MEFVAGIDALGRVAGEEVTVELEAADALDHGETFFLRDAGVDGRLIDDDVAFGDHFADGLQCSPQGFEVGAVVVVDRRRHGHDVEVAVADLVEISRAYEAVIVDRILKQVVAHFESGIMAGVEGVDAALVHVKTYSLVLCRKKASQRQADVTESDYADFDVSSVHLYNVMRLIFEFPQLRALYGSDCFGRRE